MRRRGCGGAVRGGLQGRAPSGNPRVLGECRWAQKVDVLAEMFLFGIKGRGISALSRRENTQGSDGVMW